MHVNLCGLGKCMLVIVVGREWICLNVRVSTCESVCLGVNIHVNAGVREWIWLNVRSTCESVCVGANMHVNVGVREWVWLSARESACESACVGANARCECWCS